ncbi:50S ribosomal protein L20 [Polystyrenella longa]|uniref:Large ribosomal subunit protein bL20 n=1 Tax=Polystyrenella longa TaxID=2528007 RepID=A0A518CKL1_9PLAN|nr:50S ribosomal protein L20 [Polystyrenella longa]QDU79763.1 50S ribosomal protein L20 [Polystyrenella longa]
MRIKSGVARRRSKNRLFKEAKGNRGGRGKLLRSVKETIIRSRANAFRDRKTRKRNFRSLWIIRLSAACRERGISYSRFINGLTVAEIGLNRKTLSELAISNPEIFDEIVEKAKAALPASV